SLRAGVTRWLTGVGRRQTVRGRGAALRDGGVESASPNVENVVTGALHRLKGNGEVLRFKDGWGLAELYPVSLRSSLKKDSKPIRKVANAARGNRPVARKSTAKAKKGSRRARRPAEAKTEQVREPLRPGL